MGDPERGRNAGASTATQGGRHRGSFGASSHMPGLPGQRPGNGHHPRRRSWPRGVHTTTSSRADRQTTDFNGYDRARVILTTAPVRQWHEKTGRTRAPTREGRALMTGDRPEANGATAVGTVSRAVWWVSVFRRWRAQGGRGNGRGVWRGPGRRETVRDADERRQPGGCAVVPVDPGTATGRDPGALAVDGGPVTGAAGCAGRWVA